MTSGLHLVTDDRLPVERLLRVVDAAVSEGVAVVQVRAKDLGARSFVDLVAAVSDVVGGRARVLVNDRVDVALAARHAGARVDGVHLGQDDLSPVVARELLGADATIGWTAHDPAHLERLARFPVGTVDYLGVGVVHATGTKADAPPVLGVEGFAAFAGSTDLPCVAIGGIALADVAGLAAAGAAGVAVVSAICAAADPGAATRELVSAWRASRAVAR